MRKMPDSCSMLSRVCINRSARCCLSSPKSSIFSSHFLARCNKYASKSAKIDGRLCDITCTPINCRVISIRIIPNLINIIQVWAPISISHTHWRRERHLMYQKLKETMVKAPKEACLQRLVWNCLKMSMYRNKWKRPRARFPWSVFWSGFGADFVRALYAPGKALPGTYKARTKSALNPLQNTLHGKRA